MDSVVTYIIDRIEDGIAVCEREDQGMVDIPVDDLPEGAKPGTTITDTGKGFEIDMADTLERAARIAEKMAAVFH